MVNRLSRIVPWQAGKVSTVIYFVLGVIFAISFGMLSALLNPGTEGKQLSVGFLLSCFLVRRTWFSLRPVVLLVVQPGRAARRRAGVLG